jgi:gliding motility-associated-like protein
MFKKISILLYLIVAFTVKNYGQDCTTLGQTPATAFPVCGTAVFTQSTVPFCGGASIPAPSCPRGPFSDKNPFWYKFTCFAGGTLGFVINPNSAEDYDWELFDITGKDPNDVYIDASLIVAYNWSAEYQPTGTSNSLGSKLWECDGPGVNTFSSMPVLIQGHNYILLISHFSNTPNGYTLSFGGGSANITDPKEPHLQSSRAICDGTQAVIKLNKRMKCSSLSADGSEFFITPALSNVISTVGYGCSSGFDMDSVILTLNNPVPPGNYIITIKNGNDGNTLKDNCDRLIPVGESISMVVYPVVPTPMDSITKLLCAPDELQLVFKKNMRCRSIAADGSDFRITTISGAGPVTIAGASGVCSAEGLTPVIKVKLSAPIQTKGVYQIQLVTGISDGNTIVDECGQETPAGAILNFTTVDTVNADFTYNIRFGCIRDTVDYFHDGRNEVNLWKWNFDDIRSSTLQNPSIMYAVFGAKAAQLIVSNGVCRDTSAIQTVLLDNFLNADFEATAVVCPGDMASYKDNSIGKIAEWLWDFGNGNTSLLRQPPNQSYPYSTVIREVPVQLIVTNDIGCRDTTVRKIKVVGNCYIAVPNAFTPNNDGLNDYLYPLNAYKAKDLVFKVYNRFGQLLFQTTDWTNKWDGTFKGQGADAATYVWILQYTHTDTRKRVEQKGTTILIR